MTRKAARKTPARGPRWSVVGEERESLRVRAALAALPACVPMGGELGALMTRVWDLADTFVAEGEARRAGKATVPP